MKRKVFVILIVVMAFCFSSVFAGGGQQQGSATARPSYPTGRITYPVQTDVTLTYWAAVNGNISPNYVSYGDVPFYHALQERTGVKLRFLHPPTGGENEQFNLIVASGDIPDIMHWDFLAYPGGPEKAITDGTIIKLNDLIDNYGPNLKDVLSGNPQYDRMVKTDVGSYFCFPFIRSDPRLCVYQGPIVRKDWLDELGLQPPVTYDDWRNVLTAFKTRKNSPAPLAIPFNNTSFMYGYGIDSGFYVGTDGRMKWGRVEPAYRDYLSMMAQWYREGLLDPDTATITGQQIQAKITNGTSGAVHGLTGSGMGVYLPAGKATDPNYDLLGVKSPVLRNGDKLTMINIDNPFSSGAAQSIGGNNRYPEITARFLDYGYSNEWWLFCNFGTPGVSYTMINGYPTYTDLILRNPNGWPIGQAIASQAMSAYGGPFLQAYEYFEQYLAYPQQLEAVSNWTIDDPFRQKLPPITPTPEESQEVARIMSEVNTYADEMMVRFILGTEPLSNFDTYISTLRRMGIDRVIEIYNAALIRYNNR